MKACVLEGVAKLSYKEVDTPKPQIGEALVKIKASGICGSDIQRVWEKGTYKFPTIPGHEFAGQVADVGENVSQSWLGQKVAVFPLLPCGVCAACETGQYAQCENYDYYGSRRNGGFAEFIAVKEWNLIKIPDKLDYASAALCEPCAIAVHALQQATVPLGGTIVIYGAGAIGLMIGKISEISGASRVVMVDIDASKLNFAKKMGFINVFNALEDNLGTISGCADVCIEGTGASAGLRGCIDAAKNFGKIICLGNPTKSIELSQKDYWQILRKELVLKGTWNSSYSQMKNDWKTALDILGKQDFTSLITHRYDLSQCNEAFLMLRDKTEACVKAMFINGGIYESSSL